MIKPIRHVLVYIAIRKQYFKKWTNGVNVHMRMVEIKNIFKEYEIHGGRPMKMEGKWRPLHLIETDC